MNDDERTVAEASNDPIKLVVLLHRWSGLFESETRATKAGSDLLMAAATMIQQFVDKEEQRRSFACGNAKIDNPNITRETIDRAATEQS